MEQLLSTIPMGIRIGYAVSISLFKPWFVEVAIQEITVAINNNWYNNYRCNREGRRMA